MTNFNDAFCNFTEKEINDFFKENEFQAYRQLETGEWIALHRLATTLSVCMDVTPDTPFTYRWCFADPQEAVAFLFRQKSLMKFLRSAIRSKDTATNERLCLLRKTNWGLTNGRAKNYP